MGNTKNHPSGYRFPPELNEILTEKAKRMGLSKNALIISMLWAQLKKDGVESTALEAVNQ